MADAVYSDLEGGSLSALITQLKEKGLISSDASIDAIAARNSSRSSAMPGSSSTRHSSARAGAARFPPRQGLHAELNGMIRAYMHTHGSLAPASSWCSRRSTARACSRCPLKRDDKPGEQAQTAVPTRAPRRPYPDRTPQEIDTEDKRSHGAARARSSRGTSLHASCPSPGATCASTRRRRRTPTPSTCTITTTTAPPTSRAS